MTIPWIAWGEGVSPGPLARPGEIRTYDTAATALWALGIVLPADLAGEPVVRAFRPVARTRARSAQEQADGAAGARR
jgi:hypothetical protein